MHHAATALLLIDVQTSFQARPYWDTALAAAFLPQVNRLITGCQDQGIPIVRIFHSDGPDTPDNPFARSSGLITPLPGLQDFQPALTLTKHRHSALVGTGLSIWLHQQRVSRLLIAGIRTEQCCETTARHGSDEGWEVDFVSEATLTFDMLSPAGRRVTAAELRERTETVLHGRFATVCDVTLALQRCQVPATC